MLSEVDSSSVLEAEDTDHNEVGRSTTDDEDNPSTFAWTPDPQVSRFVFVVDRPFLMDPSPPPTCLTGGDRDLYSTHTHLTQNNTKLPPNLVYRSLTWHMILTTKTFEDYTL